MRIYIDTMATLRSFDFRIARCGPDMLLRPLTRAGRHWASDNLPKGERHLGGNCIIPADRIHATLMLILMDGLTIAPLEE